MKTGCACLSLASSQLCPGPVLVPLLVTSANLRNETCPLDPLTATRPLQFGLESSLQGLSFYSRAGFLLKKMKAPSVKCLTMSTPEMGEGGGAGQGSTSLCQSWDAPLPRGN